MINTSIEKRRTIQRNCNWCQSIYTVSSSDIKAGRRFNCSYKCGYASNRHKLALLRPSLNTKYCTYCKQEKDLSMYDSRGRCRPCRNIQEKARHNKNREVILQRNREKYHAYPEVWKNTYLKSRFGITLEEYDALYKTQDGKCAICFKPETALFKGKVKSLAVDHCHNTGRVRGLLCTKCNTSLGLLNDDTSLLSAAISYIEHHDTLHNINKEINHESI